MIFMIDVSLHNLKIIQQRVHSDVSSSLDEGSIAALIHICISKIRPYITIKSSKTLVQALFIYRIDHGNALLQGISMTLISCLQRIENCAAQLVTCTSRREHITPVFLHLH